MKNVFKKFVQFVYIFIETFQSVRFNFLQHIGFSGIMTVTGAYDSLILIICIGHFFGEKDCK